MAAKLRCNAPELTALPLDLLADPIEADDQRASPGALRRLKPESTRRLGVENLERIGNQVGGHHGARGGTGILQAIEDHRHQSLVVRQRAELDRDADDDAQRSGGADEQLRQVVAGDVLDHLASAADHDAIPGDDGHADQKIASRPVQMSPRP